jgi:hypothetical protein
VPKDTTVKMRRTNKIEKKIANHVSDKGPVFRINKEFTQHNNKKKI